MLECNETNNLYHKAVIMCNVNRPCFTIYYSTSVVLCVTLYGNVISNIEGHIKPIRVTHKVI